MNTKIIKLDINRRLYDKIVAKQDDTKSRFLLFQLLDGAVPFNLTDRSVRVYGVKPDGAVIFNDLTVTHSTTGFCLLELTNQMLAIAGTVKLELMITEGDKKLTSIPFEMEVIKKINSNAAVESSNEFRSLLNALKEIDDWNREFADKSGKLEELYTPRLNELGSQLDTKANPNVVINQNILNDIPESCLKQFLKAINLGNCTVVFWGDSITEYGNPLSEEGTYFNLFCKKLQESFPNVTFNFVNLGYGGRTILQAQDSSYIYKDTGKVWRELVKEKEPDLLFIAFGMNPTTARKHKESITNLDTFIKTFSKVPSVIFQSNWLPCKEYTDSTLRLNNSRITRYMTKSLGYGLMDIGRKHKVLRDGEDERKLLSTGTRYMNEWTISGGYFMNENSIAVISQDKGYCRKNIDCIFAKIKVKMENSTGNISQVDIGKLSVQINEGNVKCYINNGLFKTHNIGFANQYPTIEAIVYEGKYIVKVEEVEIFNKNEFEFFDNIKLVNLGFQVGKGSFKEAELVEFMPYKSQAILNDEDLLGEYIFNESGYYPTRYPYGGNGVNHPTSTGMFVMYEEFIDGLILKSRESNIGLENRITEFSKDGDINITFNANANSYKINIMQFKNGNPSALAEYIVNVGGHTRALTITKTFDTKMSGSFVIPTPTDEGNGVLKITLGENLVTNVVRVESFRKLPILFN
ncbi:BppU family phage baseplate upper protein [Clostridium sp. NSJ-6]|uniref:BppU family phage baseplate upper protein n=2 Tax=Clostridium hominis TaxID=2763036 RepID=A0ABR7DCK7_9CLOT|nr:BppU family phage baseplate upper protein [Clostridium hominis]